jgi:hypothetical protein
MCAWGGGRHGANASETVDPGPRTCWTQQAGDRKPLLDKGVSTTLDDGAKERSLPGRCTGSRRPRLISSARREFRRPGSCASEHHVHDCELPSILVSTSPSYHRAARRTIRHGRGPTRCRLGPTIARSFATAGCDTISRARSRLQRTAFRTIGGRDGQGERDSDSQGIQTTQGPSEEGRSEPQVRDSAAAGGSEVCRALTTSTPPIPASRPRRSPTTSTEIA